MGWWQQLRVDSWRRRSAAAAPAPVAEAPDLGALSQAETSGILAECARDGVEATLALRDRSQSWGVRFTCCAAEEVLLDLPPALRSLQLAPLSICWVSFVREGESLAFLSQILRVDEPLDGCPRRVAVRAPTRLAREDLRSATRVPGLRDAGLTVRIVPDDRRPRPAVPLDLSLSGMLVELPEGDDPRPSLHEVVDLKLEWAGQSAWLLGVVRRREGRCVGLHFPESLREGRIEAPGDLARIVRSLESRHTGV